MANETLRKYAKANGVYLWQIAAKFGMVDSNFCKKMRFEFSDEDTEKAKRFIDEIVSERRAKHEL